VARPSASGFTLYQGLSCRSDLGQDGA
jgi:hypothetical protein